MTDTLHHRGPDDEAYLFDGPIALGHKRLNVIDISKAARQPMGGSGGRHWLVFNGEISNSRELRNTLRQAGHKFTSQSDTEVLLKLYETAAENCLHRIHGMYAFAVWDREEGSVFLARDPFGIKPLYYVTDGKKLIFASEIKALLSYDSDLADIDEAGLADYLTFQYVFGDKTLFRKIRKLPPGHWMKIDRTGQVRTSQFWSPNFTKTNCGEVEAADRLAELLDQSVAAQLHSDVPVGFHLSGGIDSASIVGLAKSHMSGALNSFTVAFDDEDDACDDSRWTEQSAAHFETLHYSIRPTADDFVKHLDRLIWHLDEPVAAPGAFAQFLLSKLASEHVTVTLGGQGADELIGGYARYYIFYLDAAARAESNDQFIKPNIPLNRLLENLDQLENYTPLVRQFGGVNFTESMADRYLRLVRRNNRTAHTLTPDFVKRLGGYDPLQNFRENFNSHPEAEPLDEVLNYETTVSLPALLQVEDRTSMAWSVESRVPFLDRRIADFLFSLPASIKFKNGRLKYILRRAMENKLPGALLDRKRKVGLPVPLTKWLSGPLREWARDLFNDRRTRERGIFDQDRRHPPGANSDPFDRSIWGQLCLEIWFRAFFDQTPCPAPAAAAIGQRCVIDLNSMGTRH